MKKYLVPEIELVAVTSADIMNGSDTIIGIGGLYYGGLYSEEGSSIAISEYTGEPIEQ